MNNLISCNILIQLLHAKYIPKDKHNYRREIYKNIIFYSAKIIRILFVLRPIIILPTNTYK